MHYVTALYDVICYMSRVTQKGSSKSNIDQNFYFSIF